MKTDSGYEVDATFLFHGMVDYWGGNCDRWDGNAGCLFAYYGPDTTVHELVDGWVDDFEGGGDCDSLPEAIDSDDIRKAILEMLSPKGLEAYKTEALSEFATEFAEANGLQPGQATPDDFHLDESPVAIILIRVSRD